MDENKLICNLAVLAKERFAFFPKLASQNKTPRHLVFIADKVQSIIQAPKTNKFKILIVPIAPRHGKTQLLSVHFPAWYLGHYPKNRMIMASYGDTLACQNSAKAKDVFEKWGLLLFGVDKSNSIFNQSQWDTEKGGGVVASGVGGGLTGFGADCLIMDDYLKDHLAAESQLVRDNQWAWWESVVSTRLHPGAVVIIIATRWNEDDIIGRLLLQHEKEGAASPFELECINLPAIAEENDLLGREPGKALWPWWMNEEILENKRKISGPYYWNALFRGNPISRGGNLFKTQNFRYYIKDGKCFYCYRVNEKEPIRIYDTELIRECFVDPAIEIKTENDPTGMAAWGYSLKYNVWLLLDALSERIEHTQVMNRINEFARRNGCIKVNVENEKLGKVLVKTSFGQSTLPFAEQPTGGLDKYARATPMATAQENERVFFPKNAPFLSDYEKQLTSFPRGKHDEYVDVTSMASKMESGMSLAEILAARNKK